MLVVVFLITASGETLASQSEVECATDPTGGASSTHSPCPTIDASGEIAPELPPADLPTTNSQGYSFQLAATLAVSMASAPDEAPIYELEREPITRDRVAALAKLLGITGPVEERGEGTYSASGDGQLFVSPDLVQYLTADSATGPLPDDQSSIAAARDWLRNTGLSPADIGEGKILSRSDQTGRIVVSFGPADPEAILAAYPSITVSIGGGGTVLETSSRWAIIHRSDLYQLRGAERAWSEIREGLAYIETDLGDDGPSQGETVVGTVTYDMIELAYTSAGPPGGRQYLVPVYVFSGQLKVKDRDGSFTIKAYVVALANSGAPVGSVGMPT